MSASLKLAVACAAVMPGQAAIKHASLEWRRAREHWLELIAELGLTEREVRDLAARTRVWEPAT